MGMTITEKILAMHCGKKNVEPGELINARIDLVMCHDVTTTAAITILENNGIHCMLKGENDDFKWSRDAFLHKSFPKIYVIQSASETARALLLPFQ